MTADTSYTLDEDDIIRSVSGDWSEVEGPIVGQPLWKFIYGRDLRSIYEGLFLRVRAGKQLRFKYRCDTTTHRRTMSMEMRAADGSVAVNNRVLSTIARDEPLAVRAVWRGSKLMVRCSVCNLFRVDNAWLDLVDAVTVRAALGSDQPVKVVYSVCDGCRNKLATLGHDAT